MADDLIRDPDLEEEAKRELAARRAAAPPASRSWESAEVLPSTQRQAAPRPWESAEALGTTGPPTLSEQIAKRRADIIHDLNPTPHTKLQKFGHALNVIGQDIGTAYSPAMMESIPGTIASKRAELARLTTMQGQEQEREAREQREKEQSALGERTVALEEKKAGEPKLVSGENFRTWTDAQGVDHAERGYAVPGTRKIEWYDEQGNPSPLGQEAAPTPLPGAASATLPTTGAQPTPAVAQEGTLPRITAEQAPPLAAPIPQPKITYGKPEKRTEEEESIAKYLKDNNLPDTAANRQLGRDDYRRGGPVGPVRAQQIQTQIANILKGSGIDPRGYQVTEKSTVDDVKEALAAAQKAATESRVASAPEAAQARKDERTFGYAIDTDNALKYMSRANADRIHSTFEEMKPADISKDRQALRQLNDVQMNTSRYRKAIDALTTDIPENHVNLMAQLIGNEQIKAGMAAGLLPGADYMLNVAKQMNLASQWNTLSPEERNLLIGFLRAKSSVIAYQKALTGIGRTNKEQLDLEMANIPLPYVGATVADQQMNAWQENIDRATDGFPVNLPGVKHPTQIRKELEQEKKAPGAKSNLQWNEKSGKYEAPAAGAAAGKGKWNAITGKYEE